MMATDDDRTKYDSDTYSRTERDALQVKLDAVDEARDVLALEVAAAVRKYAQGVYGLDPKFFLYFNSQARSVERGAEGIQGAVEFAQVVIAEMANDFLDREEIDRAERIVENGHD